MLCSFIYIKRCLARHEALVQKRWRFCLCAISHSFMPGLFTRCNGHSKASNPGSCTFIEDLHTGLSTANNIKLGVSAIPKVMTAGVARPTCPSKPFAEQLHKPCNRKGRARGRALCASPWQECESGAVLGQFRHKPHDLMLSHLQDPRKQGERYLAMANGNDQRPWC